jgi:uncharacterized GH25 family protein
MKKLLFALFLLAVPSLLSAHDFWLEPSTFHPAPNTAVEVRLRVGQDYLGDPVPRPQELIRFEAVTAEGTAPVVGQPMDEPAGVVAVKKRGLTLVAYQSKPGYVELSEEKLQQYIREEGLERIVEERRRSPYANQPWHEMFSRCAKALLWTGSGPANVFNKRVGMPMELVPLKNPYTLAPKAKLPVQLLYRGKPLAGVLFVITPKMEPERKVAVRSDAKGMVNVTLDRGGAWMIKAVHVVPAAAGARGQWESFWASLTFELPE